MNPIQPILESLIQSVGDRVGLILGEEGDGVLPFITSVNPMAIGPKDEEALSALIGFLYWHEWVIEDALANLTDLRAWTVILTAQPANKEAEVPLLGGSNQRSMSVMEFNEFATEHLNRPAGTLGGMIQFNLVDEMYWWLRYVLRTLSGLTMVLPEEWDEEEEEE